MEEIKGTLVVEDRTKVKTVHFKYPELMNESAQEEIKNEYYNLLETEDKLFEAREKVRELENKLTQMKKDFEHKTALCTLEFETLTKETTNYKSYVMFKGMGNDTLGHYSS